MQLRARPSQVVAIALVVGVLGVAAAPSSTASGSSQTDASATTSATPRAAAALPDPANWTAPRLAAQLVIAGVDMGSSQAAVNWARFGVAGVVLFGRPPANLRFRLAQLRVNSPGKRLIISSDEEGGLVQRLAALTGRMPSAADIGRTKGLAATRSIARTFGQRMRLLGVNVNLAPVADLLYPGSFMARDSRAFRSHPVSNALYVRAFAQGLRDARVASTVKHWPGGGAVADTHIGAGHTPPWAAMQKRDLVPFRVAFASGVDSVMVGHPSVPGLTGPLPASQSRVAFAVLRREAGQQTMIMTDSLAMAAVTSSMRQSQVTAAIRAIACGADIALVQDINPMVVVGAIARAISSGQIPRAQAVASARRVLATQERWR